LPQVVDPQGQARPTLFETRTGNAIDDPIMRDLRHLQRQQGKSLGRLVSDLLAQARQAHRVADSNEPAFRWISRPMGTRVDLADKHTLLDAMDTFAASRSSTSGTASSSAPNRRSARGRGALRPPRPGNRTARAPPPYTVIARPR
jgi:hypothetical protein